MTASARVLPSAEPNVTPMIDVLLVLLIVFMLAVVRVHRTMDVQLPQPCTAACDAPDAIVLEVLPGPSYRLNGADVKPAELIDRLTTTYAGRPNKAILIAGTRGVRYDDVMSAMDVAKSAGVTVIGIAPRAAQTISPSKPERAGPHSAHPAGGLQNSPHFLKREDNAKGSLRQEKQHSFGDLPLALGTDTLRPASNDARRGDR